MEGDGMFLKIHRLFWKFIECFGDSWKFMECYCMVWKFMKIRERYWVLYKCVKHGQSCKLRQVDLVILLFVWSLSIAKENMNNAGKSSVGLSSHL